MSPPLPPDTLIGFHLRSPSRSGGKDWVGCLTQDGTFHRYWGKTGQVNQHRQERGNHRDLRDLVKQKLTKGYRILDTYQAPDGWQSRRSAEDATARAEDAAQPLTAVTDSDPIHITPSRQHSLTWDF
ncbi:hypothetical protein [Trichloromonas sp.]|uniref:hypothetical protein n=1 Tax=Trichloromonas sp. TaxID=3069249 RepID=UPI001D3B4664|nr:hypothetical protein [Desulfuromonadaceae bacterium]MDY0269081.1 hypothetical protein [Trichloromonas sp.]